MIKAYVVYDENKNIVAVLYEEAEAFRLVQLADSGWQQEETVLANNADRFFEALMNSR